MTQEELLLKDLCARQPYGVKVLYEGQVKEIQYIEPLYNEVKLLDPSINYTVPISNIKPYLRPMPSMTEEEREELDLISEEYFGKALDKQIQESLSSSNRNESKILEYIASSVIVDWLNKYHFDYRGLILKNLAIEVTEENNPYKK